MTMRSQKKAAARWAALIMAALFALTGCDVLTSTLPGTASGTAGGNPSATSAPVGADGTELPPVNANARPWITEIMSGNHAALPANGGYPDWVEVSNLNQDSLDLGGYYLSDNLKEPKAYTFPSIVLGPGQCVLVYCGGTDGSGTRSNLPPSRNAAMRSLALIFMWWPEPGTTHWLASRSR